MILATTGQYVNKPELLGFSDGADKLNPKDALLSHDTLPGW
jgi:hypothetical protein